ncbi:pyridoxal 5'-phosphate synthase glutaminase subunit PdxT [Microbacterium oleivorans]|uniref:pyridoxal 5'-phosphate synthase glutaminase subunit PdxT n=1 Tax=Microbacterium oleivorans TaxID=273677 RepID=UPI00204183B5|nr:pyridoxal 5'-phosphate synthase glutaminase subunit PdxT [Microbacterium oleivorans]MCM3696664.1 pyridoxal 5'-phosphate synthase glutaminase subunit PdxT [Microbacterium oleivorans]
MTAPRVGVLALQGDVREHTRVLRGLGADVVPIRRPEELALVEGVVLPGGESSVIDKLSRAFGMREPLISAIDAGMPVLGTCAGLILLADRLVDGIEGQQTFGGLDVTVRRNAFGGQVESFETELDVPSIGEPTVRATFIRAPVVEDVGPAAEAIATLSDGRVVGARQGAVIGLSFHPELDAETRFHEMFLASIRDA